MGHHHCCSKQKVNRGLWSPEEDEKLIRYISAHGHGCWTSLPKQAGIQRCGKSCRLRWINYLRPDLKRGSFSAQEERIIIDMHRILGNRWAQIAKHLPGRTDNEVKNFWNSCIRKKLIAQGLDPKTHNLVPSNIISHQLNDIKSADLSKSHNNLLSSTAPFTSSFPMKRKNPMGLLNPSNLMTLPSGATLHESTTPISSSLQYHDTDALMSLKDEINYNDSLEHTNASSSSCYHQQEGLTADAGMWLACSTEAGGGGQVQTSSSVCKMDFFNDEGNPNMERSDDDSATFDFELMMGSAMVPSNCGLLFGNWSSMEHLQYWD